MSITELIALVSASLALLGGAATWRKAKGEIAKALSEANRADAEKDGVAVDTMARVVGYVDDEMSKMRTTVDTLRMQVVTLEKHLAEARLELVQAKEAYRNREQHMNLEMGKLRKRVRVLEDFIKTTGHVPPT